MFEHTVVSDLDQLICLHSNTDDELERFLRTLRASRPDLWRNTCEAFKQSAYFFIDSHNQFVKKLAKRMVRELAKIDSLTKIMEFTKGNLSGLELKKENSSQYILFLADASCVGKVRVQYFDAVGFYGHSSRNDYQTLLKEMVQDGFTEIATGALDELSAQPKFFSCTYGAVKSA